MLSIDRRFHPRPRVEHVLGAGAIAALFIAGVAPASATVLDFGAALQQLEPGTPVDEIVLDGGGWMRVRAVNHGGGPDLAIVFDSGDPSGGEEGAEGENEAELGHVLVIAEDDEDEDGDGLVDEPDDESGGGVVCLKFSHAGRLSFTLVDVDRDEEEPRIYLFHEDELVGVAEGESLGDDSAQEIDLSEFGDVDAVRIHLDGSASLGAIRLDVIEVGVEATTWSGMKLRYVD